MTALVEEKTVSEELGLLSRLERAINSHDLELMVACFASDYQSSFPAHPDRDFHGTDQMKSNWSKIFMGVPNIRAKLLRQVTSGDTSWGEWEWEGRKVDGAPFAMCGVTIQGIQENRIVWTRLYMEPIVEGGGVDAAIRREIKPAQ